MTTPIDLSDEYILPSREEMVLNSSRRHRLGHACWYGTTGASSIGVQRLSASQTWSPADAGSVGECGLHMQHEREINHSHEEHAFRFANQEAGEGTIASRSAPTARPSPPSTTPGRMSIY
jgi:hypothetical protein